MSVSIRTRQIEPDVLNVLAGAQCDGPQLRITQQLDRKLYAKTNNVLEALGGKWERKAKAHVFGGDAAELVEEAVLTGVFTRTKQDFGFFETPRAIVDQLIDAAGVKFDMEVLEPSAGHGAIADVVRELGAIPTCYELQPANVTVLAEKGHIVRHGDFLQVSTTQRFGAVVMNPPFAKRDDIRHILHAAKFLKPGGRLASVASSSVSWRDDRLASEFRSFVQDHGGAIEELPAGSFKESGTMVNTALVTLRN